MSKLNDAKGSFSTLNDEIQERQNKISKLVTSYDSVKKTCSLADELFSQVRIKGNQYLQVCSQISKEDTLNIASFENISSNLVHNEDILKELEGSYSSYENMIKQLRDEISQLTNDIDYETKSISDKENSRNSFNAAITQNEVDLRAISDELANKMDHHQQKVEQFNNYEKHKKDINQRMSELQSTIENAIGNINNLDQEIKLIKHAIEEKNYTKLNTHKETLDFERSSIPIKQNLVEMSDKYTKTKLLLDKIRKEEESIANEIDSINKKIQEFKLITAQNGEKQQNELMTEARLKGESQANAYRLSETEKSAFKIESEYKIAKDELDHLITNEIELKSSFVQKMGEAQHLFGDEDNTIRQLTLDVNEIKVKIDMLKSKLNANKQLEDHLIKNEEEISAISSQSQRETKENQLSPASNTRQSIIPTILKLKKNKSRILDID